MMDAYKMQYETESEALRCAIECSLKSFKEVAAFIFPHLKVDSAYSRLMACLNTEKEDKLSLDQVLAISKYCQRYDVLFYMAEQCGFEKPKPIPLDHAESLLIEQFVKAKTDLEKIASQLEKNYGKRFNFTDEK